MSHNFFYFTALIYTPHTVGTFKFEGLLTNNVRTCCLYRAGRSDLDAGKSITRAIRRGGLWKSRLLGALYWLWEKRVPFGPKKVEVERARVFFWGYKYWLKPVFRIWIRIHVDLYWFGTLDPDLDPYWFGFPGSGSVLGIRIRIQESYIGGQKGIKYENFCFQRRFVMGCILWFEPESLYWRFYTAICEKNIEFEKNSC